METLLRLILDFSLIGFISLFALYCILKSRSVLMVLLVPLMALAILDSYVSLKSLMGTSSTWDSPGEQVQAIATYVERKEWIHLWYVDPETHEPRAVKVPYDEKSNKAAKKAGDRLKKGQSAFLVMKKKREGQVEIEEYSFSSSFHAKKNPENQDSP